MDSVKQSNPAHGMDLEVFVEHYVLAALWSSIEGTDPSGGKPLDDPKYSGKLTRKARAAMREDCQAWLNTNAELCAELRAKAEEFGYGEHVDCGTVDPIAAACAHDLWLTRNGHGCGFWDRGLGELGERLTASAKRAGERTLYPHRGWIYQS
jgi:hypothetical protein